MVCGLWSMVCGLSYVVGGLWTVVCGLWPMTHTQVGMRPQRPMQAMDTDNWDHSPSMHG